MTFDFGSVSGSTFALVFFLLICGTMGVLIYALLAHPRFRRVEARQLGKSFRSVAMLFGGGIGLALFLLVYFTSINGFYRLKVDGEEIRLHYILPSRTYTLSRDEITELERAYGNRSSWRLRIRTRNGKHYESAQAGAREVDAAREQLEPLLRQGKRPAR
jgi:hypothetical protein